MLNLGIPSVCAWNRTITHNFHSAFRIVYATPGFQTAEKARETVSRQIAQIE